MLRNLLVILLLSCCSTTAFAQNGNTASQTLQLVFQPAMDIQLKKQSSNDELTVRSNKTFKISVHTEEAHKKLALKIINNTTGGSLNSSFANYSTLSSNTQDLIMNGRSGDDQTLAFAYNTKGKSQQDLNTVGVIYTATQP